MSGKDSDTRSTKPIGVPSRAVGVSPGRRVRGVAQSAPPAPPVIGSLQPPRATIDVMSRLALPASIVETSEIEAFSVPDASTRRQPSAVHHSMSLRREAPISSWLDDENKNVGPSSMSRSFREALNCPLPSDAEPASTVLDSVAASASSDASSSRVTASPPSRAVAFDLEQNRADDYRRANSTERGDDGDSRVDDLLDDLDDLQFDLS